MVNPSGYVVDFGINIARIVPCIRVNEKYVYKLHELHDDEKYMVLCNYY